MLLCELERAIGIAHGKIRVTRHVHAVRDRSHVAKLPAQITRLHGHLQSLLDQGRGLAGIALQEGDEAKLPRCSSLPALVAELFGERSNLFPILARGLNVPFEVDVALDRKPPEPQSRITSGKGTFEMACELLRDVASDSVCIRPRR